MSSRKRRGKGSPARAPEREAVAAPVDLVADPPLAALDEALESNAPREVAIEEGNPSVPPLDLENLPPVELPPEWARLDPEATLDLRTSEPASTPLRDDPGTPIFDADEDTETAAPVLAADADPIEPIDADPVSVDRDDAEEDPPSAEPSGAEPVDAGELDDALDLADGETTAAPAGRAETDESDAPAADEDEGADSITTSATDRERANLKGLVEALVFATDKPIKVGELARLTDATPKLVRTLLAELAEDYKPRGIQLGEVAGGYLFRTNVRYGSYVRELTQQKPVRLSRAQLEALAILAYRQPITRPEIDEIRGVDSGPVLKMLLERELVRILGKRDEVGRPIIYGTTPEFLEFFGLKSLKDLPNLREFTELTDESHAIAEKELGESWRGPAADAGGGVIDVEIPTEEEQTALDAEAARIAVESAVEHVLVEEEPVFAEPADPADHEPAEDAEPTADAEPTTDGAEESGVDAADEQDAAEDAQDASVDSADPDGSGDDDPDEPGAPL